MSYALCPHDKDRRIETCAICKSEERHMSILERVEELERDLLELTEDFNSYHNREQDDHA